MHAAAHGNEHLPGIIRNGYSEKCDSVEMADSGPTVMRLKYG
jgi:hypothetical protein